MTNSPRTWRVFGGRISMNGETRFLGIDVDRRSAAAQNTSTPIAELMAVEDPTGDHLGWLATGEVDVSMIQHQRIFSMQFAYPVSAEVTAGHGVTVRLRIDAVA